MKYALLVYDASDSWRGHTTEHKHALHGEYHALASFPGLVGHYRLGSPSKTTTVRVENDSVVSSEGPLDSRRNLRALYLLESHDLASVIELAAQLPAARMGGAVEVFPLIER